ncbi:hypothetical protein H0H81_005098 [Sphagnurus paluster]|uniref:Uncharacterized protein n=1 Tax=Sphagnurus paluster TaxID=117069 RepID=A0A9P7GKQ5_9AGAR|nr:hypothetical protein H0H81_005098 [Sphagnurus paluster]
MLAFETILCILALFKGYETFRSSSSPFHSGRHLVSILLRDSLLYYFVMFATYLTNLLVWAIASQNLLEIPIGFSVAMSCVLGNRIILNVRSVNKEQRTDRKSEKPLSYTHNGSRGVLVVQSGEKSLSEIEMGQLRSMRAGILNDRQY